MLPFVGAFLYLDFLYMPNILISPRFKNHSDFPVLNIQSNWTNLLLEQNYQPVVPFLHTKADDLEIILSEIDRYLSIADGLIMQGGADIDPVLYSGVMEPQINNTNIQDWIDYYLVQKAVEKDIPVFGVCRGFQMINVALGGTLIDHLPETMVSHSKFKDVSKKDYNFGSNLDNVDFGHTHSIQITRGSILENILNTDQTYVNSIHHQGIDKLGRSLKVEAIAPDGLVEAISISNKNLFAVQWHPEIVQQDKNQKQILLNWLNRI